MAERLRSRRQEGKSGFERLRARVGTWEETNFAVVAERLPVPRWSDRGAGTLARPATVLRSGPEKKTAGKSARAPNGMPLP